jgi:F0F1-type ATP synthase assembly protein I
MVSFWWVVVALVVGTCAGVLVVALMRMAGGLPEPSATETDADELRMVNEAFLM